MSQNSVKFDEDKRHSVYNRDGYKCGYCGTHDTSHTGVGLSIDHIQSRADGGEAQNTKGSPGTNLITACHACNFAKQDKTPREWSKYINGKEPPPGGIKVDWKGIRGQAKRKIDIKAGERLAKAAKEARDSRKTGGGGGGPGVQHDPSNGQFTSGSAARRTSFRATISAGETLAIDPGASGIIHYAARGRQPSPRAFGFEYDIPGPLTFDPEAIDEGVAVLCLDGPIEHHDRGTDEEPAWCHSYEAIAREVERALAHAAARALILKIDSPGGVAAGMGETHRAIRRLSKAYGKSVYAFADEAACSAAYHLASACAEVWTTESGAVGSVGVILCTIDETKRLEKDGVAVRYVVTGKRKADLHPGTEVTSEIIDVAQAKVDKLGRQFFRAVAHARSKAPCGKPLANPAAVEALQASVYIGYDAVRIGLADGVASWVDFLGYVKASVSATVKTVNDRTATATHATAAPRRTKMATKTRTLQSVASAASDAKRQQAAIGVLGKLAKLFGLGADAVPAAGKMKRVTKTTKNVTTEEEEGYEGEEEEEEEEEESDSTGSTGTGDTDSGDSTGSTGTDEEEEEEEEEEERGSSEEEEEKAVARAERRATKAADAAYAAAIAASPHASALALRSPSRLRREIRKATGATTVDGAMTALSRARKPSAEASAEKLRREAESEKRLAKVERGALRAQVNAIVTKAKAEGRGGATSREGRDNLRALGMQNGTAWLKKTLATLPIVANHRERLPKTDDKGAPIGAPGRDEQAAIADQMFAGMPADQVEKARVDFAKRMNGSAATRAPRS